MEPVTPNLHPLPFGWEAVTYAEDQPEYLQLPVVRSRDDEARVISRWRLTWRERLRLLWRGELYLQMLTFHHPLQPVLLSVEPPTLDPTQPTLVRQRRGHIAGWQREGNC